MSDAAPICRKCKTRKCRYYGRVGGYSVQCKACNEAQSTKRRAAAKRLREAA